MLRLEKRKPKNTGRSIFKFDVFHTCLKEKNSFAPIESVIKNISIFATF